MKKLMLIPGVAIMLVVFTSFISDPGKQEDNKKDQLTATSMPDDVHAFVTSACVACHATGGKKLAMSKINFSDWDSYPADKKAKKSAAMCNVLTKGVMPPKSFKASHPEVVPTQAQIDMICNWSKTLADK